MTRVQFSIGQGFSGHNVPLTDLQARKDKAFHFVANAFGGFHTETGDGGWMHEGHIVIEPDLTITTVIEPDKLPLVDHAAMFLAEVFSQASVLVTLDDVHARFVESPNVNAETSEESLWTL